MGRQRKSGGTFRVPKSAFKSKISQKSQNESLDDDDDEPDIGLDFIHNVNDNQVDDDGEDEVFDLALGEDEDDEADEDDEEDEEEEEDDDDDENDGEGDDVRDLVENLPAEMRRKILSGTVDANDDDEDNDDDSENEDFDRWGRKKEYWTGDTADLEIGQAIDDAEDEEKAAKELHKKKMSRMTERDFYDEFDEEDDHDDQTELSGKASKRGSVQPSSSSSFSSVLVSTGDVRGSSERRYLALGSVQQTPVEVESIPRDTSKMTKAQALAMLKSHSPELPGIVDELKGVVEELQKKLLPVKQTLQESQKLRAKVSDDVVDFLEVKQQILLSYCLNVTFYLFLKAKGVSVSSHPVMKQLLEMRYLMEKMRPLDGKLKYQIDRLVRLAGVSDGGNASKEDKDAMRKSSLRPDISALLGDDDSDDGEEDDVEDRGDEDDGDEVDDDESEIEDDLEGEGEDDERSDEQKLYQAPKMLAVPYEETEKGRDKFEKVLKKKRDKLRHSEILDTLRAEFGTAPETSSSSGVSAMTSDERQLREEEDERKRFEEERFVRLTLTRKEKQSIRRRQADASRLDNLEDIGDIGEFEELAELSSDARARGEADGKDVASESEGTFGRKKSKSSALSGDALQQAVNAFVQSTAKANTKGGKASVKQTDDELPAESMNAFPSRRKHYEDADVGIDGDELNYNAGRKRQRAPEGRMNDFQGGGNDDEDDDIDGDDDLLADFARKKKAFLQKKKEHYTAEPKYAGYNTEDAFNYEKGDKKRAATYEIMKNKGLTPHRKKENRNPRVKKRKMFEKAVVARKGQVRDVITGMAGSYGGEMTGIKANISRSRKISN